MVALLLSTTRAAMVALLTATLTAVSLDLWLNAHRSRVTGTFPMILTQTEDDSTQQSA
jgi:hypothetical protein